MASTQAGGGRWPALQRPQQHLACSNVLPWQPAILCKLPVDFWCKISREANINRVIVVNCREGCETGRHPYAPTPSWLT